MTDKTQSLAEGKVEPKVKVRVLKDKTHRHRGRDYGENAELELTKDQAQWLVSQKTVEVIK